MSKPVILTGLRANNDLHIGNYFGALLPLIDMAKNRAGDYQINLFVPDLHSFTTPIDHSKLQEQIMNNLKLFVAAGLPIDNPDVHIYRQSYIPAHSELAIILNNFTGMGEMSRMTQFKDKSGRDEKRFEKFLIEKLSRYAKSEKGLALEPDQAQSIIRAYQDQTLFAPPVSVGLFDYPVLMAADILLYGAKYVPVGDDQSQHIEITRDLAFRLNKQFGEILYPPLEVKKQHEFFGHEQGLRIKDLSDPTKKMSKSDETGKGIIFLGDDPEVAAKKIMSATTDSKSEVNLDYENQPGISNLLQIHALLSDEDLDTVAELYSGQTNYGQLKKEVSEQTKDFLTDFHSRFDQVDMAQVLKKLKDSESKMNEVANGTLLSVQKAIGLR